MQWVGMGQVHNHRVFSLIAYIEVAYNGRQNGGDGSIHATIAAHVGWVPKRGFDPQMLVAVRPHRDAIVLQAIKHSGRSAEGLVKSIFLW